MLIAPAVLVGAVVLLVTRGEHGHFAGAKTHAPGVEEIVIKGDTPSSPRLLVYRQKPAKQSRAAGSVRLPSGARAARGDVLQLAYDKAPDRLYGVLLSIDGAGRVTLHLPEEGTPASATLTSLREMPLPSAYELDDAPDFERFMLITSTRPFAVDVALGAARALASQGSSARTLPLPLDPSYGQTSVLLLKISKGAP
jgi:hypothetical protein